MYHDPKSVATFVPAINQRSYALAVSRLEQRAPDVAAARDAKVADMARNLQRERERDETFRPRINRVSEELAAASTSTKRRVPLAERTGNAAQHEQMAEAELQHKLQEQREAQQNVMNARSRRLAESGTASRASIDAQQHVRRTVRQLWTDTACGQNTIAAQALRGVLTKVGLDGGDDVLWAKFLVTLGVESAMQNGMISPAPPPGRMHHDDVQYDKFLRVFTTLLSSAEAQERMEEQQQQQQQRQPSASASRRSASAGVARPRAASAASTAATTTMMSHSSRLTQPTELQRIRQEQLQQQQQEAAAAAAAASTASLRRNSATLAAARQHQRDQRARDQHVARQQQLREQQAAEQLQEMERERRAMMPTTFHHPPSQNQHQHHHHDAAEDYFSEQQHQQQQQQGQNNNDENTDEAESHHHHHHHQQQQTQPHPRKQQHQHQQSQQHFGAFPAPAGIEQAVKRMAAAREMRKPKFEETLRGGGGAASSSGADGATATATTSLLENQQQQPTKTRTVPFQLRSTQRAELKERDRPLLHVDIDLPGGKRGRISVHHGDTAPTLSRQFAFSHALGEDLAAKLERLLSGKMNDFFASEEGRRAVRRLQQQSTRSSSSSSPQSQNRNQQNHRQQQDSYSTRNSSRPIAATSPPVAVSTAPPSHGDVVYPCAASPPSHGRVREFTL